MRTVAHATVRIGGPRRVLAGMLTTLVSILTHRKNLVRLQEKGRHDGGNVRERQ